MASVYNMAQVDFNVFHHQFLPHFLQQMDGLDNDQRQTLVTNFHMEEVCTHFCVISFIYLTYKKIRKYDILSLVWLTIGVPEGDKLMILHSCLFCVLLISEVSSSCIQSLMLFIHDVQGLPLFFTPGTVPCSIVFERVLCFAVCPNHFRNSAFCF